MSLKLVTPKKMVLETIIDTRGSITIPKSVRDDRIFTTGVKVLATIELVDEEQPDAAPREITRDNTSLDQVTDEAAVEEI